MGWMGLHSRVLSTVGSATACLGSGSSSGGSDLVAMHPNGRSLQVLSRTVETRTCHCTHGFPRQSRSR